MFEILKTYLTAWNAKAGERQKLQQAYLMLAVIIVLAAGIISLFDPSLGRAAARVAVGSVGIFLVNAIVWNLLHSSLLQKLAKPTQK